MPLALSVKKVPMGSDALFSGSRLVPSLEMLCSWQKSSQHELPICVPAWPMCKLRISLMMIKSGQLVKVSVASRGLGSQRP